MSIGKSAIKRVENNGYSKVKSVAPEMQNSVIAAPAEQVTEKLIAPVEKKMAAKKPAAKKPAVKKAPAAKQANGFVSYLLGEELPYYLL